MSKRTAGAVGLAVLIGALSLAACGGNDEEKNPPSNDGAQPSAVTLEADDFYFKPTSLSVESGQTLTVKVENEGKAEHTFTVDTLGVDVEIPAGEDKEVDITAPKSGSFDFYCRYHRSRGMTGTITVGEGSAAAPTKDGSASGYYGY